MRLVFLLLLLTITAQPAHAVNLNKGQSLACGAILCGVGIALAESRSKCIKVLRDWNIYVATLGPFRSPPKCPILDRDGATAGYNAAECSAIQDLQYRQLCEESSDSKPAPGYYQCDQLTDVNQRYECENSCDHRYKNKNGATVCQVQ